MDITTPESVHGVCPDMVHAELKASQKRKRSARMAALKRRAQAKAPLFADEFIARELAEKSAYYNAEITPKDIEVSTVKVAERANFVNKDFDPNSLLYDTESDIEFSIRAIELRALAKSVLPASIYYRALAKSLHHRYVVNSPVYRSDHWFNVLRHNGHEELAWQVHCEHGGSMPPPEKPRQPRAQQSSFDFDSA